MSTKSKDYLDLSIEVSKEATDRIIEDSKLAVSNLKESVIREESDKQIMNKVNENHEVVQKKLKELSGKVENLQNEFDLIKKINISEEENFNKQTEELLKEKEGNIEKINKDIKDNVKSINEKIVEKANLPNDTDSSKVNYELEILVKNNEELNNNLVNSINEKK